MDILGTKKLVSILEAHLNQLGPAAQAALAASLEDARKLGLLEDQALDLLQDIDRLVDSVSPDQVQRITQALPIAALETLGVAHRLLLRSGNSLRGLFPLTINIQPNPGSILERLLRSETGRAGALTTTITPAHIPG